MNFSKIPIALPWLTHHENECVNEALSSTWISSRGKYIDLVESSNLISGRDCNLLVSNGTIALTLAFETLIGRSGLNVLCPNITFGATANSIVQSGNLPVFYEQKLSEYSFEPDYELLENSPLLSKCTALVIVHLYGECLDLNKARNFCDRHNLLLIEDCAEAPFSTDPSGLKCGTVGDASTFSFFANKVLTSGEGGLVSFRSHDYYLLAKQTRDHGMNQDVKYQHDIYGSNYRMTNIQAALLYAQLSRYSTILDKRSDLLSEYISAFSSFDYLVNIPRSSALSSPSPWFFVVIFKKDFIHLHANVYSKLSSSPIEFRPLFLPLSQQGAFSSYPLISSVIDYPHVGFMLPLHHKLTPAQIIFISSFFSL